MFDVPVVAVSDLLGRRHPELAPRVIIDQHDGEELVEGASAFLPDRDVGHHEQFRTSNKQERPPGVEWTSRAADAVMNPVCCRFVGLAPDIAITHLRVDMHTSSHVGSSTMHLSAVQIEGRT